MSRRRSPGEGSISPTSDGAGWEARLDLGRGPNGKRVRKRRRARTKTEAIAILKTMQNEAQALLSPATRRVSDAVETHLSTKPTAKRTDKTIELERWRANLLVEGLGHKKVKELAVTDCDRFLTLAGAGAFGKRPIKREALARVRSLLVEVLRNEMRIDHLSRNVGQLSQLPVQEDDDSEDPSGRRSLTYAEFRLLSATLTGVTAVYFDLSARNGLRPAEARGLRWECVDLSAGTLTIDAQMNSKNELTGPKTRRSARTIPLDTATVEILGRWHIEQEALKEKIGPLWLSEPDLVVTTSLGTPINRSNIVRSLIAACDRCDVERITPYELRHTAITFQVEAGHEGWRIADWAGTSERMIEDVYRHRLRRVSDLGPVSLPDSSAESGNEPT